MFCGGPAAPTAKSYLLFSFHTPGCFLRMLLGLAPLQACQVSCCFFCCPDPPAPGREAQSLDVVSSPSPHTAPENACRDQASKDKTRAVARPPFTPNKHYQNSLVNRTYNCVSCTLLVGTSSLLLAHHACFS